MTTSSGQDHTGFRIKLSKISQGVFLPKYYDPEITAQLHRLQKTHNLVELGDLLTDGHLIATTGDEIGKMAYGTGTIPFVRTSDVSNWELKTDAKQGVSDEIYAEYGAAQDVQVGDILFVRDGTYLIGQVALVTATDLPMLYQSHLVKFRVAPNSLISSWMLIACLSTPIVKRQIKAKQFTADIIDTIGDRYRELVLPIPKNKVLVAQIELEIMNLMTERSRLRDKIRKIPYWVEGYISSPDDQVPDEAIADVIEHGNQGFLRPVSSIRHGVFIPKYYDPELEAAINGLSNSHDTTSLQKLVDDEVISW
jgi:type I restriction enzyme M protein